MPNFVIIHDKKMGFVQESSFWGEMPLCTGSLHYQFNTKYETLPNIEPKLAELTLVITNGKKNFIGLKYKPPLSAPLIIMKGSYVPTIKKYCAENKIQIVNDAPLASKLFEYDTDEYIPCETWEKVARILAKGEKQSLGTSDSKSLKINAVRRIAEESKSWQQRKNQPRKKPRQKNPQPKNPPRKNHPQRKQQPQKQQPQKQNQNQ